MTPSSIRPAAVSPEYSKYASSTTSGRAVGQLAELAGRIVRPAADRQHRVLIADLGACDPNGDLEHRIGRVVRDRDAVSRTGEGTGDEQDQVVRARTEDDVLRRNTRVVGDRLLEPGIAAVRIRVDARQLLVKSLGPCRWQQLRRRVAVETDDLGDVRPVRRAISSVEGAS